MTKKTRTTLFLFCLLLFVLTATTAVFYSLGYRIDFKTKKVVQTGAFFLRVEPKQAKVFINGKLIKKTDFLFGTVLIKNLLPENYEIRVEKDGFYPWQKNLEIKEKEVTEAKNIVLISKELNLQVLTTGLKNFWAFPDGRKFIFLRESEDGWILTSYAVEDGKENDLIKEDALSKGVEIGDLKFSYDQKKILLEAKIKGELNPRTYIIGVGADLREIPPVLISATTSAPLDSEHLTEFVSQRINNDNYYLDNSGRLLKNGEKLTEMTFKDFKVSPDSQKLVLIQDYEIWVLFLEPQFTMPQRTALEKVYLTRFSKKIGEIFWYNSNYLIFSVGEEIKITEIDNRDGLNIVDLTSFTGAQPDELKIFFDQANKKLYILNKGNLFISEKL